LEFHKIREFKNCLHTRYTRRGGEGRERERQSEESGGRREREVAETAFSRIRGKQKC
jgi:hypothetical protein